jgi:hypothetical protein
MSDGYASGPSGGAGVRADSGTGTVETAKHEAREVTDTAAEGARDVAQVAKDEAASVAREARDRLQDLYAQSKDELSDQAAKQQHRMSEGLRSFSDELGSMARQSDGDGMARTLVQSASRRVGDAADWLGARDPAGVLDEVKRYARRRPGVFIAAAAVAGVLVGRLTRALAQGAAESSQRTGSAGMTQGRGTGMAPGATSPGPGMAPGAAGTAIPGTGASGLPTADTTREAPVYSETASRFAHEQPEGTDERPDAL